VADNDDRRGGLAVLPARFRWSDARDAGISQPRLYRLLDRGLIERIGHGLYQKTDAEPGDLDLIEIASAAERATLCLTSALARHDLTDLIPSVIHAALPRGAHPAAVSAPVKWHPFQAGPVDLGRDTQAVIDELHIGIYSPERSIIDSYRLRHLVGHELGREALRRWLRHRDSHPSELLDTAKSFPKSLPALRHDLEVLL
jgi:predicted transcriptional regulator of viral defense system